MHQTDQKNKTKSEEKLKDMIDRGRKDLFIDLLDNAYEAACVIDKDLNILFCNRSLEELTGNEAGDMINQKCKKNLLIQGAEEKLEICAEMCPVIQSFKDRVIRNYKAYILHKEGFRIPAFMRVFPIKNKNDSLDGSIITFHEYSPKVSMPHLPKELKNMNMLDPLTETGNRRYIKMNLGYRLDEMKRYGLPVGILFCILDDIDSINDVFGTVVKDKVIKMIGKTISKNIRFFEFVGRWDEDSFLVILSNVNIHKLDLIANKLRLLAEKSSIQVEDKLIHITISVGGVMAESTSTIESMVEEARNLAHSSQKSGKNKVTLFSEEY